MRKLTKFLLLAAVTLSFSALDGVAQTKPKGYYTDSIDFSNAPKRINDKFPLSDQKNKEKWKMDMKLSDEFAGTKLNETRWYPNNPRWKGRKPTQFHPSNVTLNDGFAEFRINQHGDDKLLEGYTHSAGFIVSKELFLYGYFEARLKINDSPWVGGFWMSNPDRNWWTEIDICENCPGNPKRRHDLGFNIHVFRSPAEHGGITKHFDKPSKYYLPFELQKDYHVWGLDWNKDEIIMYFDGVEFVRMKNEHWHQPLRINFNNESNKWFGALPNGTGEDEVFMVDYFRVWNRK